MKILKPLIFTLFATCVFFSCATEADTDSPVVCPTENPVKYEILKEYGFSDLLAMEKSIGLPGIISFIGKNPKYEGNTQMKVYKVMFQSENPNGSKQAITLSGVLIVPPLEKNKTYRRVVAPPSTFISRSVAPTERVIRDNLNEHLIFWIIEAYRYGYAVMVPDYPGYGDSYGECFIPYMEKSPMVRTTVEYVNASLQILEKETYKQRDGLLISGYSLAAYVALQLAREIETKNSYTVDYLMVGGSPCNLLQEANLIRASSEMSQPYFFPFALLGFKKNGYPQLNMSDYLKEPYATETMTRLDGQHEFEDYFPTQTTELFTAAFINNVGMSEINKILDENSVKPWPNKCRIIMSHGADDVTVYYAQAKDFADQMNANGGSVAFKRTTGTHGTAGVLFYLDLLIKLDEIK